MVINLSLERGVELHESLHGFWKVRGTETMTLEAKLAQKLDRLAHKPLFQVFLYVQKAYDLLDRGKFMDIFRGFGMGPNLALLLSHYWGKQSIVPKAGKFLGRVFGIERGVTHGYPALPMIFYIVVEIVVRAVLAEV